MKNDSILLNKLMRRVGASRGTVFLEFAIIAPLATMLVMFAADFCRVLKAEQQIEIASRAVADIESHYKQDAKYGDSPCTKTKTCVADYLKNALGHPDNTWTMTRIEVEDVPSIFEPLRKVFNFFSVNADDKWIVKLLKAIFSEIVNILLGGTQEYVRDLCFCDKMVGAACAVKLESLFPGSAYAFFAFYKHEDFDNIMYVAPTEYERINYEQYNYRKRSVHHCWMPIMETMASPPETWIRVAEKNLRKSFIISVMKKLGLSIDDYRKEVDE